MSILTSLRTIYRSTTVGIGITILVLLLQFSHVTSIHQMMQRAEGIVYDLRLRNTLEPRTSGLVDILIVDLDERTMSHIGWPWPRPELANLITTLADAGTAVIAFDVIFSEAERNPAKQIQAYLTEQQTPNDFIDKLVPKLDGDKAFVDSFANTDIVLGYVLQHDEMRRGQLPQHTLVSNSVVDDNLQVESYKGYVTSLPRFHQASSGEGFINSSQDSDGFLRKSALLYRYGEHLYPSLSLEAARLYALADTVAVKTQPAANLVNVEGVIVGNELIPTDAEGRVLIPYRGVARSFPYISAIDVLNQSIDMSQFEGAVVFVGTSAIGLADLRATPMGVQYPGVEVHANVLEGILAPQLLKYRPDWWEAAIAIYLSLLGLLLSYLLPKLGPSRMALTGIIALLGSIAGNIWLWSSANIALPLFSSIMLVFFIAIYNIIHGFFTESRQRQQIKSIFNQYVPPAHIDKMLNAPNDISMEGERKELTVLFSDIRNFTSISERLTANQLKQLLNRYFDPITECIFVHQGTIDKYVGDMVMAFWGAPLNDANHAQNAVKSAVEMLKITEKLRSELAQDDLPAIHIGIGINTGHMNVGDMGSTFRKAYTVLGDAVNLGSRLENLTKFYNVTCLVSEATKAQCPELEFRCIDKVKVKGKNTAVSIFQPIDNDLMDAQELLQIPDYHRAYEHYLKQEWQAATKILQRLQQACPNVTLYQIYLQRIVELQQQRLPDDWDGSFTHTSK